MAYVFFCSHTLRTTGFLSAVPSSKINATRLISKKTHLTIKIHTACDQRCCDQFSNPTSMREKTLFTRRLPRNRWCLMQAEVTTKLQYVDVLEKWRSTDQAQEHASGVGRSSPSPRPSQFRKTHVILNSVHKQSGFKMTGAENPPPSNFRRLVIGCIGTNFCN